MADTRTFTTQFKIGAAWTGQPGVAKAQTALGKLQRQATLTGRGMARGMGAAAGGIAKVTTALGLAAAAYVAVRKAQELWQEGWKASEDAVKVQEALGVAAQRNAARYKTSGKAISDAVSKVSEKVAAVGFDTEDATAGTTKLLESMSPSQIAVFGTAFGDLTAKLKGATPGAEGFQEVATQINSAILKGKAPWLSQLGLTDKQLKAFKKMEPAQRRAFLQQQIQNKLQGEAVRVFDTTTGKIAKAAKAREDVGQALTAASVAQQGKLAETHEKIWKSLEPTAQKIGDQTAKAFEGFSEWIDKHQEDIARLAQATADWGFWLFDKLLVSIDDTTRQMGIVWGLWVKSIEDTKAQFEAVVTWIDKYFIQPIYNLFVWLSDQVQALWQLILPKLDALNLANQQANQAAGTGGEAARRATEGRIIQQRGHGYAPYTERGTAQLQSAGEQSAAAAQKATPVSSTSSGKATGVNPALLVKLDTLQQKFGKLPITSGRRSAAHNAKVGGARGSQHLHGNAVDIDVSGMPVSERLALIDAASKAGIKGVGVYKNALHFDLGGRRAWGPSYGRGSVPGWAEKAIQQHEKTVMRKGPPEANTIPGGVQYKGKGITPAPPTTSSMVPSGSSLKDMIKDMTIKQRMAGAFSGQSIAMNPINNITVNGVAPGREALMAKRTALAMRDHDTELLRQLKSAKAQEQRLGYV